MSITGEAYGGGREEARVAMKLVQTYMKIQEAEHNLRPLLQDLGLVDDKGRVRIGRVALVAKRAREVDDE